MVFICLASGFKHNPAREDITLVHFVLHIAMPKFSRSAYQIFGSTDKIGALTDTKVRTKLKLQCVYKHN